MLERHNKDLASYIDGLQASGRYSFTKEEIPRIGKRTEVGIEAALRRLKKKGRIVSPRRGFLVIVPIEHSTVGSPPASWFIHDMMAFLSQPYYVGLLSAASLHGAAHQQPMKFQVITDKPTRRVKSGKILIEFHMNSHLNMTPVVYVQTETGNMRISTPEATAFDLVRFPATAGYLNNVATVLGELAEVLNEEILVKQAETVRLPDVQRLGYLLDRVGARKLADPLAKWLPLRPRRAVLLRPGRSPGASGLNRRWYIIPNEVVEVDL